MLAVRFGLNKQIDANSWNQKTRIDNGSKSTRERIWRRVQNKKLLKNYANCGATNPKRYMYVPSIRRIKIKSIKRMPFYNCHVLSSSSSSSSIHNWASFQFSSHFLCAFLLQTKKKTGCLKRRRSITCYQNIRCTIEMLRIDAGKRMKTCSSQ